jgi:hypothetical protein
MLPQPPLLLRLASGSDCFSEEEHMVFDQKSGPEHLVSTEAAAGQGVLEKEECSQWQEAATGA